MPTKENQSLTITEVLMGLDDGGTLEKLATELRCCVSTGIKPLMGS